MVVDKQHLDKFNLEELVRLLIEKTTEFLELMGEKNADAIKLRDLKLQIENLRAIIAYRRSLRVVPAKNGDAFIVNNLGN
jgi:hypothetical protein